MKDCLNITISLKLNEAGKIVFDMDYNFVSHPIDQEDHPSSEKDCVRWALEEALFRLDKEEGEITS